MLNSGTTNNFAISETKSGDGYCSSDSNNFMFVDQSGILAITVLGNGDAVLEITEFDESDPPDNSEMVVARIVLNRGSFEDMAYWARKV